MHFFANAAVINGAGKFNCSFHIRPDLVPSDFHLFSSLPNSLKRQTFNPEAYVTIHQEEVLINKDMKFFEQRIKDLSTK